MSDELATDEEIREALAERASREIMERHRAAGHTDSLALQPGWFPMPSDPPDWVILLIEKPWRVLQQKSAAANTIDRDAFDREIRERFGEVGIIVDVLWHYSKLPGCYIPEVEPYALTFDPYDPDRQVRDVTADVLGLGESGVIK